jgi:hypothetical protein
LASAVISSQEFSSKKVRTRQTIGWRLRRGFESLQDVIVLAMSDWFGFPCRMGPSPFQGLGRQPKPYKGCDPDRRGDPQEAAEQFWVETYNPGLLCMMPPSAKMVVAVM